MADERETDGAGEPRKLDGRRTHIIDRALDYVALAEQGLSATRIARRRRKSQGYVSIVLRLGRAIVGMEPGEIAALRSPRVTWKLAQRIVREDADVVSVRHQLRAAVGGFSTHNVDGRKHRKPAQRPIGGEAQRAVGVAWGWDAAWFARDPLGFAESHLSYLVGVQQNVQLRAGRAVASHGIERVSVGQGIRSLQRTLAAARTPAAQRGTPAERRALALLEILERKLAEAQAEAGALLAGGTAVAAGQSPVRAASGRLVHPSAPGQRAPAAAAHGHDALGEALEADLHD